MATDFLGFVSASGLDGDGCESDAGDAAAVYAFTKETGK
jgi:hypothetical protein